MCLTDRNRQELHYLLARHYSIVCFAMASCNIDCMYKLPQMQCLDQDTQKIDLPAWMPDLAA